MDEAGKVDGSSVVAGREAAEMFEATETSFDPVSLLCRINLCFGLLAFVRFVWSLAAGRRRRWVEKIFLVPLILSAVALTATLALRSYTAGHLPLSNGYETMLFVAWCVLLIALGLRRRFPIVTASGLLLSGFALLVAWLGMTNPQITPLSQDMEEGWEGCLSVPGLRGAVNRFSLIRYQGLDPAGVPIDRTAEGFHARVVQHECDHLIGRLYPSRITDFAKFGFTEVLFPDREAGDD